MQNSETHHVDNATNTRTLHESLGLNEVPAYRIKNKNTQSLTSDLYFQTDNHLGNDSQAFTRTSLCLS